MARRAGRQAPGEHERGYALLTVLLMAALIALYLYAQLPRVAFESERDKEQTLIDRGEQYKRAIQLYVIAVKKYPAEDRGSGKHQRQALPAAALHRSLYRQGRVAADPCERGGHADRFAGGKASGGAGRGSTGSTGSRADLDARLRVADGNTTGGEWEHGRDRAYRSEQRERGGATASQRRGGQAYTASGQGGSE